MQFVDLSHPLIHGQGNFPWDPKLSIISHGDTKTLRYNMTQVCMGTHQGTHLDAMFHFLDDGKTIDQMPLDWFYGPVQLLRIPKKANEEITPEDFMPYEEYLKPGAKILYETGWHHHFGEPNYFSDAPSLTQDGARYLASKNIKMLGMDTGTPGKDWYEIHHILLAADKEVVIVEGLANLDKVPDQFTFCGFPLNFKGRDGSPIRAVGIVG
ncbi:MAG TPA: cyclase family protein [Capsulimonadaceae bacterium]|jgi:kynurenine formamidase